MPTISVITPCYNYAHYLAATLDCLLRQTYADWECVVIDDGSTDASGEVALQYSSRDGRIRYLHQENRGLPAARNTGLQAAHGKYVFCLDADDLIHDESLGWLMAAMEDRSQRVCLMQARNFVTDPAVDSFPFEARPRAESFLPNILADNFAPPHCYLAERAMVLAAGGFDTELRACEDWDLWIRLALLGAELKNVDRIGAWYRRHPTSMSAGRFRMWDAALRVRWKTYQQVTPNGHPRSAVGWAVPTTARDGGGHSPPYRLWHSPNFERDCSVRQTTDLPENLLLTCRRTIAIYLRRDWLRLSAKLARHGERELSRRFFDLAGAREFPADAHFSRSELWTWYGLYRFTRPCQPPTAKECEMLKGLCTEMEEAFAPGPRRPVFLHHTGQESDSLATRGGRGLP